jgi:hypothetical protein
MFLDEIKAEIFRYKDLEDKRAEEGAFNDSSDESESGNELEDEP